MSNFVSDKITITKKILELVVEGHTRQDIRHALASWWINKRTSGGLRLSELGNQAFLQAGLEYYDIEVGDLHDQTLTSARLLVLDRKLSCPYYLIFKKRLLIIRLFDSRIAAMVHLYGDLASYLDALKD